MPFNTFCSCAEWSGVERVGSQKIHFELFFITRCAGASSTPKQYLLVQTAEQKNFLGIPSKKIIIPAPLHRKAFVLLYKSETNRALFGRLSKS